jgi:hypothetical protein
MAVAGLFRGTFGAKASFCPPLIPIQQILSRYYGRKKPRLLARPIRYCWHHKPDISSCIPDRPGFWKRKSHSQGCYNNVSRCRKQNTRAYWSFLFNTRYFSIKIGASAP